MQWLLPRLDHCKVCRPEEHYQQGWHCSSSNSQQLCIETLEGPLQSAQESTPDAAFRTNSPEDEHKQAVEHSRAGKLVWSITMMWTAQTGKGREDAPEWRSSWAAARWWPRACASGGHRSRRAGTWGPYDPHAHRCLCHLQHSWQVGFNLAADKLTPARHSLPENPLVLSHSMQGAWTKTEDLAPVILWQARAACHATSGIWFCWNGLAPMHSLAGSRVWRSSGSNFLRARPVTFLVLLHLQQRRVYYTYSRQENTSCCLPIPF